MLTKLTHAPMWVTDQDEALAFYTDTLGLEVREDVSLPEFGGFRWLTVGVPGQEDVSITLLAIPGPPVFDEETKAKVEEVLAKGAMPGVMSGRTTSARRTRSSRARASSSRTSRPSSRTASTPGSGTRSGTRCGSCSGTSDTEA